MADATLAFNILTKYKDTGARKAAGDMDRLGHSGSRMATSLKRAAAVGAVALTGSVLLASRALIGMTKSAVADEAAQKRLALTLRNNAGATADQVAATEKWITAQGVAYGVTDDDLRPALARLVTATHDVGKAQKLASLAMNVSAGTGKSLKQVTEALMKAQNGSIGGLSKLGIATKDASGKTKTFAQVTEDMAKTFKGQAAANAATLEGKMGRLKVILSETGESIGAKLIPAVTTVAEKFLGFYTQMQNGTGAGGQFVTVLKTVGSTVKDVAKWLNEHRVVVAAVIAAYASWKIVATAMKVQQMASLVILKMHTVGTVENMVVTKAAAVATKVWAAGQWLLNAALTANPIGLIVVGIAALAAGFVIAYKKSETFRGIVNGLFRAIKPLGEFIGKMFVGYVKLLASAWLMMAEYGVKGFRLLLQVAFAAFDGILSAADKGLGWIPGLGGKIHAAREAFTEFGDKTIAKLKSVEDSLHRTRDAINGIPGHKSVTIDLHVNDASIRGHYAGVLGGLDAAPRTAGRTPRTMSGTAPRPTPTFGPAAARRGAGSGSDADAGAALLTNLVKGISSKKVLLTNALGKVTDYIKSQTDKIRDLMSQKMDLAGQFQGFTSSVFSNDLSNPDTGAGPSAGDLIAFQKAELAKALQIKADTQKLIKEGLSKDLITQLSNSGESGIAQLHALAGGSVTDVKQLSVLNAQTEAALAAAGMSAGNAVYGDKIAQAQAAQATAKAMAAEFQKVLREHPDQIVKVYLNGHQVHTVLLDEKHRLRKGLDLD